MLEMIDLRALLVDAADRAIRYLDQLNQRPVAPTPEAVSRLEELDFPFPETGINPADALDELDSHVDAITAMSGPRYFGFVTGGTLPASLAANWLAGAWDQNAFWRR